jgi:hypothetical protein
MPGSGDDGQYMLQRRPILLAVLVVPPTLVVIFSARLGIALASGLVKYLNLVLGAVAGYLSTLCGTRYNR